MVTTVCVIPGVTKLLPPYLETKVKMLSSNFFVIVRAIKNTFYCKVWPPLALRMASKWPPYDNNIFSNRCIDYSIDSNTSSLTFTNVSRS